MHPARPSQHPDAIASRSALERLQAGAATVARWCAIALGFSVITSTALNGVLMAVLLLAWLASGGWGEKLRRIRDNEVALAALALMLLATAGALWSQGTPDDVVLFLNKYTKLLLIPILVTVLVDPADRRRGLIAMAAGLVLSLALSYALPLGLLPAAWPLTGQCGQSRRAEELHLAQHLHGLRRAAVLGVRLAGGLGGRGAGCGWRWRRWPP